jgi:hypothetical protein
MHRQVHRTSEIYLHWVKKQMGKQMQRTITVTFVLTLAIPSVIFRPSFFFQDAVATFKARRQCADMHLRCSSSALSKSQHISDLQPSVSHPYRAAWRDQPIPAHMREGKNVREMKMAGS